jgi:hypothetical protein
VIRIERLSVRIAALDATATRAMAWDAQRAKVVIIICPAVLEPDDVVDLLGNRQPFLLSAQHAQVVVAREDALPYALPPTPGKPATV